MYHEENKERRALEQEEVGELQLLQLTIERDAEQDTEANSGFCAEELVRMFHWSDQIKYDQ